jgi:hypothetical protein
MRRASTLGAGLSALLASSAFAATVTVPEKSQPESITVAPNGELILGSAASPKTYRAKKGSATARCAALTSTRVPRSSAGTCRANRICAAIS